MQDSNVLVPIPRYEELLGTETRVKVVVERIMHDDTLNKEDILWILDTEVSTELAQELCEKRKREREMYLSKILEEEQK